MLSRLRAEIVEVHAAVTRRRNDHDTHAGHDTACRVGAVRGRGNQDDAPLVVAPGLVIRPDDQQPRQLALGARVGLQRHGRETGDFAERRLELPEDARVARGLVDVAQTGAAC